MAALLTRPRSERSESLSNPFKLPNGERLRRELVKVFREQRTAIVRYLRGERKDQLPPPLPQAWPEWHDFGLGVIDLAERFTPLLTLEWEKAGAKFAPRVGLDPNVWEVVNPNTEQAIWDAALAFSESMNATTSDDLNNALERTRAALIEGVVEHGETIPQLTKRVNAIFDGAEKWRARRIAQTETSRAVHAAQEQSAIQSGVVTGWKWLASSDACPMCLAIAARAPVVHIGDAFAVIGTDPHYSNIKHPPAHPHCCLPETPIVAPIGIAGIKAHYDGPVVRICCSDGSDVTVTPNHMLLTPDGFTTASKLMQGDNLLRYRIGEAVASRDPNNHGVPTSIEKVFDAWAESSGVASGSVPVASEYLHGDAAFCEGDIHVVTPYRLLWDNLCACGAQPFAEGSLCWPNLNWSQLARKSDLAELLFALRDATDGGVGFLRECKAGIWTQEAVAVEHPAGSVADFDSSFNESFSDRPPRNLENSREFQFRDSSPIAAHYLGVIDDDPRFTASLFDRPNGDSSFLKASRNCMSADAERLRNCLGRFSGKVTTCQVINVQVFHYSGPVYDVTTGTSLYLIGNGIVSSNCRCSMVEVLDTDEQPSFYPTLQQPEPATEEEQERVLAGIAERDEAVRTFKPPGPTAKPKPPKLPRKPRAKPKPAEPVVPPEMGPIAPATPGPGVDPSVTLPLPRFATAVLRAASVVPVAERYAEFKVWIIDAYREFRKQYPNASVDTFKQRLIEANRELLLTLARMDLPGRLSEVDRVKDRESEVDVFGDGRVVFHFIKLTPP
jgi:hypothetical protein